MAKTKYFTNVTTLVKNNQELQLAQEELKNYKKDFKKKYPGRPPRVHGQKLKEKKEALVKLKQEKILQVKNQRLNAWLEEFIKNGGNATAAVETVFYVTNKNMAIEMGVQMMKETRIVGRALLEKKGMSYGKLMDMAIWKMYESKDPHWWDRVMKIGGYEDFLPQKNTPVPNVVNIIGSQNDLQKEFGFTDTIEGEITDGGEDTTQEKL